MNYGIMKNVRRRLLLLLFITWPTQHITKIQIPFSFETVNGKKMQMKVSFLIDFDVLLRHFVGSSTIRNDEFAVASLHDAVINSKKMFFFSFSFSLSFRFLFRKLYFICPQWYNKNNDSGHLTIISFVLFKWFHWFVHLNTFVHSNRDIHTWWWFHTVRTRVVDPTNVFIYWFCAVIDFKRYT